MRRLHLEIPLILCKLERVFPPSLFDSMEHLPVHLAYEAMIAGLVQYRWMYHLKGTMAKGRHAKCGINDQSRARLSPPTPHTSTPLPPVADDRSRARLSLPTPHTSTPLPPIVDDRSRARHTSTPSPPVAEDTPLSTGTPTSIPTLSGTQIPPIVTGIAHTPTTPLAQPSTSGPQTSIVSTDGRILIYVYKKKLQPQHVCGRAIFIYLERDSLNWDLNGSWCLEISKNFTGKNSRKDFDMLNPIRL